MVVCVRARVCLCVSVYMRVCGCVSVYMCVSVHACVCVNYIKCRELPVPVKDGCSLDGRQESGPCNFPVRTGWAPSSDDERSMCAYAYTCT